MANSRKTIGMFGSGYIEMLARQVPAFTDFKLHDITDDPGYPNREPLDQNHAAGTSAFFAGNGKFITRKLWGIANQHPFGHNGLSTSMRF